MELKKLKEMLVEIKKIQSIAAVLQWDQETYMPEGAGQIRAEHLSYLSALAHKRQTGEEFRAELAKLVDMETGQPPDRGVNPETARLLYLTWKNYRDASALPQEFVEELSLHESKSLQAWSKSRQEDDFDAFSPFLEKMVELKRREAGYYGYETTPYDSLIDKYEPQMTSARLDELFSGMRDRLVKLVKRIAGSGAQIDETPLTSSFDVDKQWQFGMKIIAAMGFDLSRGRQDKSAHPFTTSFHPSDVRITTRLNEHFFKAALFGTVHETGHALYEQGLSADDYGTAFGEAVSYGFHESQSRLWENLVARGRDFWQYFFPILKQFFPEPLEAVDQEAFYRMINTVTPSLIRVEADEVTYSLHIMLRFEIEKMLLNENLAVKELPELWNAKMQEYLGVRPETDKVGVLQDIHWSMGAFGYFPTYALGNLYAVPIMNQAVKEIPNLHDHIKKGEFMLLRTWLFKQIHQKGQRFYAEELIQNLTGTPLTAQPFLDYLEAKYKDIYGL
jgi:carboxypeptidase Taq